MARTFASFEELKTALAGLGPEDILAAVTLTPALATDILSHDPVNRKLRSGNLAKLERDIREGFWDARKAGPVRFLPTLRLADGQHRCRAVVNTETAIVVSMCIVPDTVGCDEGSGRTLADHLELSYGFDNASASLAAVVTKAICHVYAAGNRDFLKFFEQHQPFITECAEKPQTWLADQKPNVMRAFKPSVLAMLRARAIAENNEPAESVDQLLYDAINDGTTAPEGSPRRALAKQFSEAMYAAASAKKPKRSDVLKWLLAALKYEREGILKNILTAKMGGDKKRRTRRLPPRTTTATTLDQPGASA